MFRSPMLLLILTLCAPLPAAAEPDADQLALAAQHFAVERARDARRLIVGPEQPQVVPVPPEATCEALYERRLAIMRAQLNYRPPFYEDPRNTLAVAIGTVFEPAYFFLAYTGITGYTGKLSRDEMTAELDALRYASATRHCFVD